MKRALILAAGISLVSLVLFAQDAANPAHAPDGGTMEVLMSIFIPPLPNAPFSAVLVTEWTRKLEDGTTVALHNRRMLMRDSAGRIYQERRQFLPTTSQEDPRITRIEISDPSMHRKYFCNPNLRTCQVLPYAAPTTVPLAPEGPLPGGKAQLQRLDLGKSEMAGVEVNGTRETLTLSAGSMGNDRPIDIIKEFWYSPHLGLNVSVKRTDPRHGTETFIIKDLSLTEPSPDNFVLPAGFRVIENPPLTSGGKLNQSNQ